MTLAELDREIAAICQRIIDGEAKAEDWKRLSSLDADRRAKLGAGGPSEALH